MSFVPVGSKFRLRRFLQEFTVSNVMDYVVLSSEKTSTGAILKLVNMNQILSSHQFPLLKFSILIIILMRIGQLNSVRGHNGSWSLLLDNAGIASMHTAVTRFDTAIFLDRTNIGASQIKFTNGFCRDNPDERRLKHDCTAHSVMFDPSSDTVRPLTVLTDTWCSSGQFFANGSVVQTGGDYEGLHRIRRLDPCDARESCDWVELTSENLTDGRWYASNQLLPDGVRQILVGGRDVNTYEFVPKRHSGEGSFALSLLSEVNDEQNDNMYPFVHLLPDGNLFIFANRDSVLLDYVNNNILKKYPRIPGEPRNYPSAGSSVLLPLNHETNFTVAEVLVCGGAQYGAFLNSTGSSWPASSTCGRIVATESDPTWSMETMPINRVMGDMIILPTGDVLIINGAQNGSQGWEKATNPAYSPITYATNNAKSRFQVLAPTTIARVYHSTANLLRDGRILVAGSNTHEFYTFEGEFPTELRVEAFSPPYLDSRYDALRPTINSLSTTSIKYGSTFEVEFTVATREGAVELNLLSAPFTTHSFGQGQRMLKLAITEPTAMDEGGKFTATAAAPASSVVAPASFYVVWAVQAGVPSTGVWVQMIS